MSVHASRFVHRLLMNERRPHEGGLSHAARSILLLLADDANVKTGQAFTGADALRPMSGYAERNVRYRFDELRRWGLIPCEVRPGESFVWTFPTGPVELSTPRAVAPGVELSTPRADTMHTPGGSAQEPRAVAPGEGFEGLEKGRAAASVDADWPLCIHRGCLSRIDPWKHRARCDEHSARAVGS